MKIYIDNATQPGVVVVETDLTPANFLGKAQLDLIDPKTKEKKGFSFFLAPSGTTDIKSYGIQFVGTAKDKKLSARVDLSKFGGVEAAKDVLGQVLPLAEELEKQVVKSYSEFKAAADKIEVRQ